MFYKIFFQQSIRKIVHSRYARFLSFANDLSIKKILFFSNVDSYIIRDTWGMNLVKKGQSILVWIALSVCTSFARTDELRRMWISQITDYLEPLSTSIDQQCRNHMLDYLEASKDLSNFWAISSSYFYHPAIKTDHGPHFTRRTEISNLTRLNIIQL